VDHGIATYEIDADQVDSAGTVVFRLHRVDRVEIATGRIFEHKATTHRHRRTNDEDETTELIEAYAIEWQR